MNRRNDIPPQHLCDEAIERTVREIGGSGIRSDIIDGALTRGRWTLEQAHASAPPSHRRYGTYLNYRLSHSLSRLKAAGVLENPRPNWWQLTLHGAD